MVLSGRRTNRTADHAADVYADIARHLGKLAAITGFEPLTLITCVR